MHQKEGELSCILQIEYNNTGASNRDGGSISPNKDKGGVVTGRADEVKRFKKGIKPKKAQSFT